MIILTPLKPFRYPIYAENINPDIFQGKSLKEISELPIFEGNKKKELVKLFKIEESPGESHGPGQEDHDSATGTSIQ